MHQFCLNYTKSTKAASIECFENWTKQWFIFGYGLHGVNIRKEKWQRRWFVFAELIYHLLESFKIPFVIIFLHPPHRLVKG